MIDLEHFAHKFTFPPPGKTSGEIHDLICQKTSDSVVTLGYGPDFVVIRSRGAGMNIPRMVRELENCTTNLRVLASMAAGIWLWAASSL